MANAFNIKNALRCKCPRCLSGRLFKEGLTLDLRDTCTSCSLDFSKNDSADGPAVFLIFVLGFLIVPLALAVDAWMSLTLIVHVIIWSILVLALTIGALKPLKSLVIALQYNYRPEDWD